MQTETRLHFAADHPAFAGHFPGHPMVPGALLLDAVLHAISGELAQARTPNADAEQPAATLQPVWQITSAKFLSPVQPGETVVLSWLPAGPAGASARFAIACGMRQVASGVLTIEAKASA